jgi:hypothetical protein
MSPLRTQKKRSPGRPKENKLIRELKVKTWFAAVAEASGKTAYELEKEFAPSYVDREEFGKHRARLWDKYRLGKTMPTIGEKIGGRRPIALLVEDRYPGTLRWLTNPIWLLADANVEVSMNDLKEIYESLGSEIKSLVIEPDAGKDKFFWRRQSPDFKTQVREISKSKSVDSFIAILCLYRETLIRQQKDHLNIVLKYFEQLIDTQDKSIFSEAANVARIIVFTHNQLWPLKNDYK